MWHKTSGIIKYDPYRPGLQKKTEWWCVVNVDREITRYYRWWVDKEILNPLAFDKRGLAEPSWNAHISVIRGERPAPNLMHLWKKYDGKQIEFEYSHNVRQSGDTTGRDRPDNYWFVGIKSEFLLNIRREFGFPSDWNLHMTIGRTWNN